MTPKSKPKTAATRKGKSRAELRARLARDIASILANPETPVALYNDITERLGDYESEIDYHTPEMIEHSLAAHEAREAKRKGGAR